MSLKKHPIYPTLALVLTTSWAIAGKELPAGTPLHPVPPLPELPAIAANEKPIDAELLPPVDAVPKTASRPKSQNVTVNLINRMVDKGLLTKEEAADLIEQAEADAAEARATAEAVQMVAKQSAAAIAIAQDIAANPAPPPSPDDVRVTYVPENVRAQIREQIKEEVLAEARRENWTAPQANAEWSRRIRLLGDVRVRGEGIYFGEGNDNTGSFPNFNAINTGRPFDIAGTQFSPQLNVDQDRQRIRLRARVGVEADLLEGFTAGIRLATGDSNSPTSTNQNLGQTLNGQGGNFSKYAIWLDRGFLKYELGGQPTKNLAVMVGRFENPFFSTDIIWDEDLGFDGIGAQFRYQVAKGFTPFAAGGAFPVFNTDFNFSSNRPDKFPSDDKWLYGAQAGFDWQIAKKINLKFAAAYYDFENVEGQLSDPFVPLNDSDAGNTDGSRPAFAQKGNTYRAIRNIVPTVDNGFGTRNQFQYFGLASPFRDLALTGKLDLTYFDPVTISFTGEYIKNLDFDGSSIEQVALNNRGANLATGGIGRFEGGDTAWIAGVRVGKPSFEKRGDWSLGLSYRHVESDAVVDGFADSEFGGGGTNVEGYSLFGSVALSPRVNFGLRWMSSNEIAGPPLSVDTFQFEFGGKF